MKGCYFNLPIHAEFILAPRVGILMESRGLAIVDDDSDAGEVVISGVSGIPSSVRYSIEIATNSAMWLAWPRSTFYAPTSRSMVEPNLEVDKIANDFIDSI
jgi:hypothetical protein